MHRDYIRHVFTKMWYIIITSLIHLWVIFINNTRNCAIPALYKALQCPNPSNSQNTLHLRKIKTVRCIQIIYLSLIYANYNVLLIAKYILKLFMFQSIALFILLSCKIIEKIATSIKYQSTDGVDHVVAKPGQLCNAIPFSRKYKGTQISGYTTKLREVIGHKMVENTTWLISWQNMMKKKGEKSSARLLFILTT